MKQKRTKIFHGMIITSLMMSACAHAGWSGIFDLFGDEKGTGSSGLTNNEIIDGLKQALTLGSQNAIKKLGRIDGFYRNPKVRIPMPESLEKVEDALRAVKQDKYADEFILTLNRAAEQAVPGTTAIFVDAIKSMSIEEAGNILRGPDDAATRYFRKKSGERLAEKILPIVQKSTSKVGVTARYKSMVDKLGIASGFIDPESLDIDQYVTNKSIDGLFRILANEEKQIRKDPAARTTELLKKVFGS